MNLYFLVEGKTERKLYPSWLEILLPSYEEVDFALEAKDDNYFLISGDGYPRLLDITLPDAVAEINECLNYDFLILVIDADEVSVEERTNEVSQHVEALEASLHNCQIKIVVQNCCLESWLLGNRKVFSRNPQDAELRKHIQHYNVSLNDPELMEASSDFIHSRAAYHLKYLKQMFRERSPKISYSKKRPGDCAEDYYLRELINRTAATPSHLLTFQDFIKFCKSIAEESNQKDPPPFSSES